jgi:AraC-like DNA-binding protein
VRGTTIGKEIERERMEEARRRLDAGESVHEVVKSMQFTSANHFYRIYKRHFGHTIRQADA